LGQGIAGSLGRMLEFSVAKRFQSLEEMVDALRAGGVREVALSRKVATTISPGGEQIAFRGWIVISAQLSGAEPAEYVEQVMPYITHAEVPQLPATQDHAAELRQARLSLSRQLRAYRGEYQGVMDAARAALLEQLHQGGLSVVEPEG